MMDRKRDETRERRHAEHELVAEKAPFGYHVAVQRHCAEVIVFVASSQNSDSSILPYSPHDPKILGEIIRRFSVTVSQNSTYLPGALIA